MAKAKAEKAQVPDSQEQQDSTEERIIRAATEVFISKGFDGARMQEIADVAGINKALLHYYYRSKEQLFQTVFVKFGSELHTVIFRALQSEKPFVDKIRSIVEEEIDYFSQNPALPMFVMREISRDASRLIGMIGESPIREIVPLFQKETRAAIKRGEIAEIDPMQLLLNLFSLIRFPFILRPMLLALSGMSESQYQTLIKRRKQEVADFIIRSLQP